MRTLFCLLTFILLFIATSTSAQAFEVKIKGSVWNVVQFLDHRRFQSDDKTNNSNILQRFRTQIDIIVNEMLSGIAYFEINHAWGVDPNDNKVGRFSGGNIGSDGVGIQTKRLFLHLDLPEFPLGIYAGIHGVTYPGAVAGSVILDDDVAGILLSYNHAGKFSAVASWLRPFDATRTDNIPVSSHNKMDMFLLSLFFSPDDFSINPFFAYAALGDNVKFGGVNYTYDIGPSLGLDNSFLGVERTENANVYWTGVSVTADWRTNFKFYFDGIYGRLDANKAASRSGWFTAAKLTYDFDDVTAGLVGWWASGDGSDAFEKGSGRMPFVNAGWLISSFGFDRTYANEVGQRIADATGKVAAGIVLEDVTWIDWMTQELLILGLLGTNNPSTVKNEQLENEPLNLARYLTENDFAIEVNYEATIKLYDQLKIIPSVAYIHLDIDEDTWGISNVEDAWRFALITEYTY